MNIDFSEDTAQRLSREVKKKKVIEHVQLYDSK